MAHAINAIRQDKTQSKQEANWQAIGAVAARILDRAIAKRTAEKGEAE